MAESPSFDDIAENFEFLDEWEDRYRYVIELGRDLPPLSDAEKTAQTKVDGCVSQVWLAPRVENGDDGAPRLSFDGDSDAMIVKGLIAILRSLYGGRSPAEILEIDAPAALTRLGLDQHLSPQRSNGLKAMVVRLRDIATAAA